MFTLGLSIFILNSILGIFTIIKKRNIESFIFGIFAISGGIWALSIYMTTTTSLLFLGRLSFSGAILGIGSLFLFSLVFPNKKISAMRLVAISLPIVFFLICSFTNLMIKTVTVNGNSITGTFGPLMTLYRFYIPLYVILGIGTIIKNYKKSKTYTEKNQIKYALLAISLFIIPASTTNAVLPLWFKIYSLNSIGPIFSVLMIGLISYAILKHQLMDIKVVIQRGIIFTSLLTIIISTYIIFIFIIEHLLQKTTDISIIFSAGMTTILGIFGVPYLKKYFEKITDGIFFKDRYDYASVLHELSEILNKNILPEKIVSESTKILKDKLKISSVSFGFSKKIKADNCNLTIPIVSNKKKIGFICLGKKLSGDIYTEEDINLLKTFSTQAGTALEKAYLYKEVKDYSVTLEDKVKERTEQIESIQKEQENMMLEISHGLQTPLTIMKGQLFLLKKQLSDSSNIESIDKSIDRISTFIYRMLNLAHLKTTEESITMEPINLSETLSDLYYHLIKETERNEIEFKKEISPDIYIKAKKDYIEELISNLISNSIKYIGNSNKREITLLLNQEKNKIIIEIKDTGIGISKENLSRLFEKFYRVKSDETRNIKGAGLGLVICKKIVELHNGTIEVKSEEGKGTDFIIKFPYVK